jgi:hypothetical protein
MGIETFSRYSHPGPAFPCASSELGDTVKGPQITKVRSCERLVSGAIRSNARLLATGFLEDGKQRNGKTKETTQKDIRMAQFQSIAERRIMTCSLALLYQE